MALTQVEPELFTSEHRASLRRPDPLFYCAGPVPLVPSYLREHVVDPVVPPDFAQQCGLTKQLRFGDLKGYHLALLLSPHADALVRLAEAYFSTHAAKLTGLFISSEAAKELIADPNPDIDPQAVVLAAALNDVYSDQQASIASLIADHDWLPKDVLRLSCILEVFSEGRSFSPYVVARELLRKSSSFYSRERAISEILGEWIKASTFPRKIDMAIINSRLGLFGESHLSATVVARRFCCTSATIYNNVRAFDEALRLSAPLVSGIEELGDALANQLPNFLGTKWYTGSRLMDIDGMLWDPLGLLHLYRLSGRAARFDTVSLGGRPAICLLSDAHKLRQFFAKLEAKIKSDGACFLQEFSYQFPDAITARRVIEGHGEYELVGSNDTVIWQPTRPSSVIRTRLRKLLSVVGQVDFEHAYQGIARGLVGTNSNRLLTRDLLRAIAERIPDVVVRRFGGALVFASVNPLFIGQCITGLDRLIVTHLGRAGPTPFKNLLSVARREGYSTQSVYCVKNYAPYLCVLDDGRVSLLPRFQG